MSQIVLVKESIFLDFEEVQVVCMHEILHNTQQGWKLLCFVTDQEVKDGWQEVPDNNASANCSNCNNYMSNQHQQIHGSVVVNRPHAVMGKAQDEVVTTLRSRVVEIEGFNKEMQEKIEELDTKTKELDRTNKQYENDIERHRDANQRQRDELEKLKNLEKHLEKAKRLVGDRDWEKKVVGED